MSTPNQNGGVHREVSDFEPVLKLFLLLNLQSHSVGLDTPNLSYAYTSKSIRKDYETVQLVTVNGQVRSGMMVSEDDVKIVLRDAANLQVTISIAKDDSEDRTSSKMSMMCYQEVRCQNAGWAITGTFFTATRSF